MLHILTKRLVFLYKKILISLIILLLVFLLAVFLYLFSLDTSYLQIINEQLQGKNTSFSSSEILAIIKIESDFNKYAVSKKGASGLMQIMPSTADFIIQNLVLDNSIKADYDIFDEKTNIQLGILYLNYLETKLDSKQYVLAGYNAGIKVALKWQTSNIYYTKFPYKETKNYVKLFKFYSKMYSYKLNIIKVFAIN